MVICYASWRACCARSLGPDSSADLVMETDGCAATGDVVRSLEHVQVVVTLSASQRGKVELSLTSPSGTRQILLGRRNADVSSQGLNNWALMTVHCWGEDPRGSWTLTVSTTSSSGTYLSLCHFQTIYQVGALLYVTVTNTIVTIGQQRSGFLHELHGVYHQIIF